jgi:hypothetical protein
MTTHDPKQVVENLRNHLASHEKRIVFIFGAGTSCAVDIAAPGTPYKPLIPAVAGLTAICKAAVTSQDAAFKLAWDALENELVAEKGSSAKDNIEAILSKIRMKCDAMSGADTLLGLNRSQFETIEKIITTTIAENVQPDESLIPAKNPHRHFARWVSKIQRHCPIEIFTTNYDILIEKALEQERVPVFDGFVGSHKPFFLAESLSRAETAPGKNWTRLWKVHGSVNWELQTESGTKRIVRDKPIKTGEMILPSHYKYDESRKQPYVALLQRLSAVLDNDDTLLVTIGYSFNDEHINNIIFDSAAAHHRTHVVSLQYAELPQTNDLIKHAALRSNLMVLGPKVGIIGSKAGPWKLNEPLVGAASEFMSKVFKADALPEGTTGDPPTTGQLKLGDFNCLAQFLDSIVYGVR